MNLVGDLTLAPNRFPKQTSQAGLDTLQIVWQYRHFWLALVWMDLRTRYRGTTLGLLWSLAHPLAMTTVLCFVFHEIFKIPIRDYAPQLLIGLVMWNFFLSTILEGCQTFRQNEGYIRQHRLPFLIYSLRTALGAWLHLLIGITLASILQLLLLGRFELWGILNAIPGIVLLFFFGWGLTTLAGFCNLYFADTAHLCQIGMQILFYITPILFTSEHLAQFGMGRVVQWNPLTVFIQLVRPPLVTGMLPTMQLWGAALILTMSVIALAWWVTVRLERRAIFQF